MRAHWLIIGLLTLLVLACGCNQNRRRTDETQKLRAAKPADQAPPVSAGALPGADSETFPPSFEPVPKERLARVKKRDIMASG